ncbi:MAG: hypothetical protein RQ723_07165 [Desulfuromonadales bacterium]|nr:hypothetical protein [Desulfuromonadales bacterium]
MGLMIKVELKDGTLCRMAPKALDIFLARGKVVKFERNDGWAVVGRDPIRACCRDNSFYAGPERRRAA